MLKSALQSLTPFLQPPANRVSISVDDPPLFTTADWASGTRWPRPGPRTAGVLLSTVALLAAVAYDHTSVPAWTPLVAGWDPVMLDWPFLLALLLFAWGSSCRWHGTGR